MRLMGSMKMSEDLIKRSDAIKAIEELPNAYNGWSDAYDKAYIIGTLEEVPSADRQQEWIPCSERLPSEQGQYLVTFPLCNGEPWVYMLSFNKGKFYEADDEWGDIEYDDVLAWMPLPLAWKGADDDR